MKTIKVNEYFSVQAYGDEDEPHVFESTEGITISLKELKKIKSMLMPSSVARTARVLDNYLPKKTETIVWAISSKAEIERVYYYADQCQWYCIDGVRLVELESEQWTLIPGSIRPTKQLAKRMSKMVELEAVRRRHVKFAPGVIFIGCQTFPNESVIRTIEALEKEIKRVKKK